MNRRTFDKTLNVCRTRDRRSFDLHKLQALPEDVRTACVHFIVRQRGPVLVDLLTPTTDRSWLEACGYLYTTRGPLTSLTFVHTAEHLIL